MSRVPVVSRNDMFNEVVRSMSARRGMGAPLRDSFFRYEVDGQVHYPLAGLMSSRAASGGGRGGRTRVALYLSLLWVASGGEHESARPASFWAALLGLADPDNAGSRAIRSTWRELAVRGFVELTPGEHEGAIPVVRPLREDASRAPYTIPTGQAGDTYRRIPENAWQVLLPSPDLSGAGLVMYLVALRTAARAQTTVGLVFPSGHFKAAYGMGESTRRKGLHNLDDLLILEADRSASVDDLGGVSHRRRPRTTYDLASHYAYSGPVQPGSGDQSAVGRTLEEDDEDPTPF